jgi:ATP-dependent Clp protease ATP-binding subunit ClpX
MSKKNDELGAFTYTTSIDLGSFEEAQSRLHDSMMASLYGGSLATADWGNMFKTISIPKEEVKSKPIMKPFEIKAKLDEYIIGQEEAKTILSVAAYNHYRRINYNPSENETKLQKSNILLVGKSGMGKTLLASTLAKILDVPFVTADVTDFTPMGIVGREAGDIIKDLVAKANGDKKKASKGIVFIDEIDKMAGASHGGKFIGHGNRVMSGEVQSSFLKLLEGKEVNVCDRYGSSEISDTSNILFICAGAFDGIYKNEKINNAIGFSQLQYKVQETEKQKVVAEDIIDYGLMPEIVGRLPVIVTLDTLTKNDLVKILTEPKNSIIEQYRTMLDFEGVSFEIEDAALESIANKVLQNQTGARGLRSILEDVMTKIMFQVTQDDSIWKCVITAESVDHGVEPLMLRGEKQLALHSE